jgi:DNA polymerase I-like protein with 3'-5' exonuclease and polymerase domains
MDWQPLAELPDLRRVGTIALDTETKDDRLNAGMGSGWPFGAGYICGISVAYREGAHYFPLRHPDSNNFDPVLLYQWLRDLIASDVRIVTQNGLYDWGWLRAEADIRMPPSERLEEVGALATIVDENRYSYSLDALCAWRGLPGKDEAALKEGAAALGLPKRAKPAAHIWQMPAHFVGPYAEQDAASTLALFESLDPILEQEGTRAAYRLEIDLLPMVHEMRRRGIRIDVTAAERARDHLLQKRDAVFAELSAKLGTGVGMAEIGRTKWLAETFDQHGIKYPRTKKGNPSFTAGNTGWMPKHPHWLPQLIVRADKYNNAAVNVLQGYILDHVVNGRIHAEIHPHRSDAGGTRSLRFSYSDPPLQLMPAHDEEIAPLIRSVFLPEEGEIWAKPDISQQEFRFIVHYAAQLQLPRAEEAVERYRTDPNTDFHALVAEWTGIARQLAKNANFAKAYGAGPRKFAIMINKPEREAQELFELYDRKLPFVKALAKHCEKQANRFGHLALYDGARRHWHSWEMLGVAWSKGAGPCSREEAERRIKDPEHPWYRRYGLRRIDTRKAMNALIQGSAARHTKLWMRAVWREGIVPLLQMHDSLDCSVSSPEQAERVAQLAREVVALAVPIRVDLAFGRNWGDAKHTWQELHGHAPIESAPAPSIVPEPAPETSIADELNASDSAEGGNGADAGTDSGEIGAHDQPDGDAVDNGNGDDALGDEACAFLADMFEGSAAPIYLSSLANPEDKHREGPEEYALTREPAAIRAFLKRDRRRRALYFCTATVQPGKRRSLETLAELCGLHVDVDEKDVAVSLAEVEQVLRRVELPPSAIVASGHGLHAYWFFEQALPATAENKARHKVLLQLLTDRLGGDRQCAESSRLMRLPGSHNSKGGEWITVHVLERRSERYSVNELAAWLEKRDPPLIARKPNGKDPASGDGQAPINVDARLAAMTYQGGDGSGIHDTQLGVSAALLNRRYTVDEVTQILLHTTRDVAGAAGANWDWGREERDIRSMCAAWLRKHPELDAGEAKMPLIIGAPPIAAEAEEITTPPANETGAPKTNGSAGAGASEYAELLAGAKATFKHEQESTARQNKKIEVLSKAEFLSGFVPPDYLIDGVLQRRFIYSLTGQTGAAKTAIALRIAQLVDCGGSLDGHEVARGRVAYLVGENPDDVRMRVIADDAVLNHDRNNSNIVFVPGTFDTDALLQQIEALGELDFVIIDTSAAYFLGDDENSNAELGEHARKLRRLIKLPRGPCVLVLCHPIKHATEITQLLPRGGGSFLAEMDGNLTAWKDDRIVALHHGDKFRGAGFEPITFRLDKIAVDALKDSKDRMIPTVRAVAISEDEETQELEATRADEDLVLIARFENDQAMSLADLARELDWFLTDGKPYKSKVQRALNRLKAAGLMKPSRGKWDLTDKGEKVVRKANKGT